MNGLIAERLYHLLPELYRWRDQNQGEPLRAFLSVIEGELQTLTVDMEATYDNWFIQTCDNWVVPYIADLLGIRDEVVQTDYLPFTQRRRVANTLAYRRRKGTVAVLEQVMWDVTNWHVSAVEFHRLLALPQHLQYRLMDQVATVDLRNPVSLATLDSPFTALPRRADIRTITATQSQGEQAQAAPKDRHTLGKYNANNLGLYFWRLCPYPVNRGFPGKAEQIGYFTFSPTGHDVPLFNNPQPFAAITQRATAVNLPILLTRAILAADLSAYRRRYGTQPDEQSPRNSDYYGPDRGFNITMLFYKLLFSASLAFQHELENSHLPDLLRQQFAHHTHNLSPHVTVRTIVQNTEWQIEDQVQATIYSVKRNTNQLDIYYDEARILPAQLRSVDLRDRPLQPTLAELGARYNDTTTDTAVVLVDPECGRLVFLNTQDPLDVQNIRVDYTYGFSTDTGGGPYPRHFEVDSLWQHYCDISVTIGCQESETSAIDPKGCVLAASTLTRAFYLWSEFCQKLLAQADQANDQPKDKPRGVIRILDNGTYRMDTSSAKSEASIWLPPTAELAIVAEDGVQPTIIGQAGKLAIRFQRLSPPPLSLARALFADAVSAPEIEAPVVDRKLQLSGLRILGELLVDQVEAAAEAKLNAFDLVVEHCTILQGGITVALQPENAPALALQIQRSIVGPLRVPANVAGLTMSDSIIDGKLSMPSSDGGEVVALAAAAAQPGAELQPGRVLLERCTFFGKVTVERLDLASAVLFTEPLQVAQRTSGLVRFSYLPAGSEPPPCEHCLHETAVTAQCQECLPNIPPPIFTSRRYGQPGYAQLSRLGADEIRRGFGGIAEIGAFQQLYQPQREINIQRMLAEYLPLGLNAGVFYVT